MKKKIVSTIAVTALTAMMLAACGSNTTPAPAKTPVTQTDTQAGGVKEIKLTAKNYEFDQKEIHVKKGEKIKLTLVNGEGSHGIAIKDLNVDVKGGSSVEFTADKVGTFEFVCSVMCGTGHATMKGKLIVE
jgi:cytochrome c oxidase subunit 2